MPELLVINPRRKKRKSTRKSTKRKSTRRKSTRKKLTNWQKAVKKYGGIKEAKKHYDKKTGKILKRAKSRRKKKLLRNERAVRNQQPEKQGEIP